MYVINSKRYVVMSLNIYHIKLCSSKLKGNKVHGQKIKRFKACNSSNLERKVMRSRIQKF
jgi:hypothetical protein